jgi:hypothetical protein
VISGRATRKRLVLLVSFLASGIAISAVLTGLVGTGAASSESLSAVSSAVMGAMNAQGDAYVAPTANAAPGISSSVAAQDALASAPWPGSAIGASLAQSTARSEPNAPGSLVWLVSMQPADTVYRVGGMPDARSAGPAANFFVVVVDATDGNFIEAEDGYSPTLASQASAKRSSNSTSRKLAPGTTVCGQRVTTGRIGAPPFILLSHGHHVSTVPIGLGSGVRVVLVSNDCSRGAAVSLAPSKVFAIKQRLRASHGGTIGLVVVPRKPGTAVITAKRGKRLVGRLRLIATH